MILAPTRRYTYLEIKGDLELRVGVNNEMHQRIEAHTTPSRLQTAIALFDSCNALQMFYRRCMGTIFILGYLEYSQGDLDQSEPEALLPHMHIWASTGSLELFPPQA